MCVAVLVEESLKKTYLVQVPPVCVFRWGSLLLTFDFSRHRMSDGQTFFPAKRWALENHLARVIGIIGDRSQRRGQVSAAVVWSHWVPSLQTSTRALWSLPLSLPDHDKLMALPYRIPKGRKKHEHIILTWCSLPFLATSVLFLPRITVSLLFWENSSTTTTTIIIIITIIIITTTIIIIVIIIIITTIIIIIITLFESPQFVLSPPRGSSH